MEHVQPSPSRHLESANGTRPAVRRQSRRGFLVLVGSAGAMSLLAACGGGASSTPTSAPAKPAEAPKPTTAAASSPAAAAASPAASPATSGAASSASPMAAAPAASPAASTAASPVAAAPASSPVASAAAGPAPAGMPSYYPASYAQTLDAARKENKLLVYSIMSKDNWRPVLDGFKKKFDWIDVEALDLGSYEVFERYSSESAGNARTADLIITSAVDAWQDFIKKGELADYKSPEDDKVPAWTKPAPGIYTASTDPMVIMWNKALVQTPPKSMAELGDLVSKNAAQYTPGKIVTYEETNATGFLGHWFWAKKVGQDKALQIIQAIGATKPKLESSGGRMVDATLAGETPLGYFVSAITILPRFPAAEQILGYSLIADGTPIITRGMGLTKKGQSPNAAKLLVDYVLSSEGQIAFAEGGLTAYRQDVADQAKIHLSKLAAQVGEQNLAPFSFDPDVADMTKREDFRAKLKAALGR